MHIYYDGTRPDMVLYNGATYRYVHSLQGDILGLQDGAGNLVVEYRYDAWGRLLSKTGSLAATLGTLNLFRYRGYVYDEETGLYYLRSRYYNPNWCRFISSDSILGRMGGLLQHNLWAYCLNDPVNEIDPNGLWTINISFSLSISVGLGVSFSVGLAFDNKGNFDIQYSYAVPNVAKTSYVGGVGAGFGVAAQYTKADTVFDLYGPATYIGASGGPLWYVGGDIVSFSDASSAEMTTDGYQVVAGIGVGFDSHVIESTTGSLIYRENRPVENKQIKPRRRMSHLALVE